MHFMKILTEYTLNSYLLTLKVHIIKNYMLLSSFVFVMVYVAMCPSSFAIILTRKRELVALLLLSFGCLVTINVLWLFLTVPWVGLQFVIVVFPDHTL